MVERRVRRMGIERSLGTKRRIEGENPIVVCRRERKNRKGQWY